MTDSYYFKQSKVNGEVYLQIWRKTDQGKLEYLLSLGTARKLYDNLVKADLSFAQTKEKREIRTKILESMSEDLTKKED